MKHLQVDVFDCTSHSRTTGFSMRCSGIALIAVSLFLGPGCSGTGLARRTSTRTDVMLPVRHVPPEAAPERPRMVELEAVQSDHRFPVMSGNSTERRAAVNLSEEF